MLREWGVDAGDSAAGMVDDLLLITSELLTNAAKFCTDRLEIGLVAHRDWIEVAVTDDSPEPARLDPPTRISVGGRGLLIVDALADRWGQRRLNDDKTVWACLAVPSGSAMAEGCDH